MNITSSNETSKPVVPEEVLAAELDAWRAQKVTKADVSSIKRIAALQPREASASRRADAWHEQKEIKRHIDDLSRSLTTHAVKDLEPLLVAEFAGALHVVDGHHRLAAYISAGRAKVPVRARAMGKRQAVRLSRLVNLEGRALPLTRGQLFESVWQHLIDVTNGGRLTLVQVGSNQRAIQGLFNLGSKSTVGNMLDRIELARELKENKNSHVATNTGTGWPTWSAIKLHLAGIERGEEPSVLVQDRQVQTMATKMARWVDQYSIAKVKAAYDLMRYELLDDSDDDDASDF